MSESLSNRARRKTEELILKGSLAAGAKITERDLAERLGMSRAPVREAIRASSASVAEPDFNINASSLACAVVAVRCSSSSIADSAL